MDAHAFDRAAFHQGAVAEHGLPPSQAWVHSGFLFGWAAERDLVADWLRDRTPAAFREFADRERTGPELLAVWDGNLLDDMFSDEGLAFVAAYWRGGAGLGSYIDDYREALCQGLPSDYHVADTWPNYERVCAFLDERHQRFRETFDPSAPRVDLRGGSRPGASLDGPRALPVVPLPDGIALPRTTIGIVAARPETRHAIDVARESTGWFVLRMPGTPIGVAARVIRSESAEASAHHLAELHARVREVGSDTGIFELVPDPEWTSSCEGWAAEIRSRVGAIVSRRRGAGEPPGALALALAHSQWALVDAVAGALLHDPVDRRRVLEASQAEDRVHVVLEALRTASWG